MPRVIITGWKPGLEKISLTKLLQAEAGLSLKAAKESVDRCLAGERVSIPMPSGEAAERLAQQASDLGAVVEIERRQPIS